MSKEITYEEALIQLKEIVSKLEMKQVKIDDLASTVKEAKQLVDFCREKLDKTMKEHKVTNYNLTLEVTHHGPLINKPCVFLEIGGSEIEWKDKRAAFIVAKALKESIDTFQGNPYREVGIGIGGPHYCPVFNKIQENSNVALSHIIPNYVQPITAEMINEALEKTIEEVDFAVVDWKGLGTAEERDRVIKILEENYVEWRKTSEVKK